jgi:DNA-binding transcriptional regulator YiaG
MPEDKNLVAAITAAVEETLPRAFARAARLEELRRRESLTTEEVAELYGYCPRTLENWRCQGRGPQYVKEGKTVTYRQRDVRAWQEARLVKTRA